MLTEIEILGVIAAACGKPTSACYLDANIYDLGFDSLASASLIAYCETHSVAEFSDGAIMKLMGAQSIREIVEILRQSSSAKGTPSVQI
jgi:hypothetical protein